MVDQALQFQRKGEGKEGLELLQKAEEKIKSLPKNEAKPLMGLIRQYQGRILQALGRHIEADGKLSEAYSFRRDDPVQRAYTAFQIFINKDYGSIPISSIEVEAIKRELWKGIDATTNPREIGDFFQNLAYIEERKGEIGKAVWIYHVVEKFREIANDQRGFALTWARLGECYKKLGENQKAREYGKKALKYFEENNEPERIQQVKKNVFGEGI